MAPFANACRTPPNISFFDNPPKTVTISKQKISLGHFWLHLGAKLKYQIPYEWEHFQTIRSSALIRKNTDFATVSSVFQVVLNRLRSVQDRFRTVFCVFRRRRRRDVVFAVIVDRLIYQISTKIFKKK